MDGPIPHPFPAPEAPVPHLKTGDRALIVVIALIAAGGLLWFGAQALTGESDAAGSVVVCQTREGFYRVDPLDGDAAYTVTTAEGENRVSIAHGTVDVTWADCSNQVCVDHDPISAVGDQIVCLPHGMVLEIVADEADAAQLV